MTVSGLTMTRAVRHPVQRCASTSQSHRSVLASRTRRGRVRCSTCSWCRKASTSSWNSARDRAAVRSVRKNETSTDIMARRRIHRRPQHQLQLQPGTAFSLGTSGFRCCDQSSISRTGSYKLSRRCDAPSDERSVGNCTLPSVGAGGG
jgi:hypothetical protein